ncbi:hypothetical protein UFOVP270_43 [uncultured Caudovirales phage]|uniref:Uncharacterized protein n=1 Tax=uncultured Caudovirales phage TaxID=2100421 RepID=A0A6J5L3D7_9CAUD|nr:hypothetical protein UFOVP101_13 [uncultured Caudovirales phage]CAB4134318.1 hypothetical protein UFOVP270_43 [uncultured Caudovirales phage]
MRTKEQNILRAIATAKRLRGTIEYTLNWHIPHKQNVEYVDFDQDDYEKTCCDLYQLLTDIANYYDVEDYHKENIFVW